MGNHREVINEVIAGNGNHFSVKELLQAHIRDDKEFKRYARDRFEKGLIKMTNNSSRIDSIVKGLMYGAAPLFLLILGWLLKIQYYKP